jgi:cell division protease FtsH
MSGADIAAVVNEAALGAAKRSNTGGVGEDDLNDALERVALGRERRSAQISERAQRITAWHEAGHTTVSMMLEHASKPERVSIVPRGGAGGATWFAGDEDEHFQTRREACANLAVSYGGRAGEEILLDGDYTQGASGDIAQATRLAEHMVFEWGMSEYGLVRVDRDRVLERDDAARRAVRELLENAIQEARSVLEKNHDILTAIAEALLEHETLGRDELDELKASVLKKRDEGAAHADA